MLTFHVQDMTCSHCAAVITRAVQQIDPHAAVEVQVAEKRVAIGSAGSAEAFAQAIREAGYTPVAV